MISRRGVGLSDGRCDLGIARLTGSRRRGCIRVGRRRRHRLAPNLDPDILAAARGDDGEPVEDAIGREDLVLDCAHLVQGAALIGRKNLRQHARHGVERQHAG